jgi:hypothetical protein
LPREFGRAGYEQIRPDVRQMIAPEPGWRPAPDGTPVVSNA